MKFFDLEKVRVIIKNATNLDISYAYDDLVFPYYTAFIIQFDSYDEGQFTCYFHKDCLPDEEDKIFKNLAIEFQKNRSTLSQGGKFNLKQNGEKVDILFN